MKNRILIVFLLVIVAMSFASWQILKSPYVSRQISFRINELLAPHNVKVSFSSILPLLPLGTSVDNLKIEFKDDGQELNVLANNVNVQFDFLSLFTHKVRINLIQFKTVTVQLKGSKNKNKSIVWIDEIKKMKPEVIWHHINDVLSRLPVNLYRLEVENAFVNNEKIKILVPSADIVKNKLSVESRLSLENYNQKMTYPVDSINGDLILTPDAFKVISLDVSSGLLRGECSGVIKDYKNAQLDVKFKGETTELLRKVKIENIIQSGYIDTDIRVWRDNGINKATGKVRAHNVILPWLEIKNGRGEFEYEDNILTLMSAIVHDEKNGDVKLSSSPQKLYDFKNNKLLFFQAPVQLKNVSLQNVLKVVDAERIGLEAFVSGDVLLKWDTKHLEIGSDQLMAHSLILDKVLKVPSSVMLDHFNIWIPFIRGQKILLNGELAIDETVIPISGSISDTLQFTSKNATVNFEELGPFASVAVKGHTKGGLAIVAGKDQSYITYDFSGHTVSVDGYFLGSTRGKINYSFKKNQLKFDLKQSKIGSAQIKGEGLFNFNRNQHSYFKMNLLSAEFLDIKQALRKKLPEMLIPMLNATQGHVKAVVGFESVLSLGTYAVSVEATSPYVFILGEPFENLQLSFNNTDSFVEITQFHLRKNKSALFGKAFIDTEDGSFKYEIQGEPVSIRFFEGFQRLNLNFDTDISFQSHGQGKFDDFTTKTTMNLNNSYVSDIELGNSSLEVYNIGKEFFLTSNLFSKEITSSVYLNTSGKTHVKRSYAEFKVAVADLRKYLAIINPSVLTDSEIAGGLKMDLSSDFNWKKLIDVNLDMNIDSFFIRTPKDEISLAAPASLKIKNGKAVKQSVVVDGEKNSIEWFADGVLGKDFVGKIHSQTNMRWANIIFSNFIDNADGTLVFDSQIKSFPEGQEITSTAEGRNISVMPKNSTIVLRNFSFDIFQKDDQFYIKRLLGNINEGDVGLTGKFVWHFPYPQIHLDYNLNGMKIDFLKNSSVILSSYGKFFGLRRPYMLQGAMSFDSGNIQSELTEISGHNEDLGYDTTYLPRIMRIEETPLIELNLDYNFSNPLLIQNSLVELAVLGKGKIQGDIDNIKPVGDITLVPGRSKFMFKGNDFIISKGLIRFNNSERSTKINPSLLIVGQANVAQHTVIAEVKGDMEKPIPELRSQPSLSQTDILSLLTIGITSNQANNMDERERQLATSVGIGSIFANQLRLGKELNNMFGVKLSVTPELSQDSVNYADAISSTGNATKLKNSTKIQLRKQIADNVELSFSSTVGGTSEQIQKINVNYNLNDSISLEGLYETRESTIENRLTQPESLGVDLKMIMEFE